MGKENLYKPLHVMSILHHMKQLASNAVIKRYCTISSQIYVSGAYVYNKECQKRMDQNSSSNYYKHRKQAAKCKSIPMNF